MWNKIESQIIAEYASENADRISGENWRRQIYFFHLKDEPRLSDLIVQFDLLIEKSPSE